MRTSLDPAWCAWEIVGVRESALVLDAIKPDWWQHVDPILLDLEECETCVCGQNGLYWDEIFYETHRELAEFSSDSEYEPLWLAEIAARSRRA